jgi:hypothetical protein
MKLPQVSSRFRWLKANSLYIYIYVYIYIYIYRIIWGKTGKLRVDSSKDMKMNADNCCVMCSILYDLLSLN